MERKYPSGEYEVTIDEEGRILLPASLKSRLKGRKHVTIHISEGTVEQSLRRRNVSETEIEAIARKQLEHREQVIFFLKSEGMLAGNRSFTRRAKSLLHD